MSKTPKKLTESEIKKDMFTAWLDHPVTKALMHKAERIQSKCRASWETQSWGVPIDELPARLSVEKLAYLRGKHAAFKSLSDLECGDLFKESKNDD
jgi:hypothetical protein